MLCTRAQDRFVNLGFWICFYPDRRGAFGLTVPGRSPGHSKTIRCLSEHVPHPAASKAGVMRGAERGDTRGGVKAFNLQFLFLYLIPADASSPAHPRGPGLVRLLLFALYIWCQPVHAASSAVGIGDTLSDFALTGLDGRAMRLGAYPAPRA